MRVWSNVWMVVFAVLWIVYPTETHAGCAQAACPVESSLRLDQPAARGELLVDASWEYIDQDQPRIGRHRAEVGERASPEHDEVQTINRRYRLLGEYGVTPQLAVGFFLPIVHLDHKHIDRAGEDDEHPSQASRTLASGDEGAHGGAPERWSFSGVGDVQLWARYALCQAAGPASRCLTLGGGLKLPTGSTDVENDDGEEAEMTLQPGTGSVDPLLMVSFVQPVSVRAADRRQVWTPLFAALNARVPGSDGRYGYRAGTELVATLGATYSLIPKIDLLGQLNFRWRDRDDGGKAPGVPEENTGGEALFVSPGVRAQIWRRLAAYSILQLPVYQRVNGIQLTSEWNVMVGLHSQFDL